MSHFICPNCDEKHYIFGDGGAKKISEQFKIPFLGEIPLNYGIMSGSDLGKPIMTTHSDSPSADAFRTSAKMLQPNVVLLHQIYKKKWNLNHLILKLLLIFLHLKILLPRFDSCEITRFSERPIENSFGIVIANW